LRIIDSGPATRFTAGLCHPPLSRTMRGSTAALGLLSRSFAGWHSRWAATLRSRARWVKALNRAARPPAPRLFCSRERSGHVADIAPWHRLTQRRHEEARCDAPRVFDPLLCNGHLVLSPPPATASTRGRARAIPASVGRRRLRATGGLREALLQLLGRPCRTPQLPIDIRDSAP
jgi:hypothetical protein